MAIQGLENGAAFRVKHEIKVRAEKRENKGRCSSKDTLDSLPVNTTDKDRTELISLIRQKIKKGFYNSDAVIDDLSYGFAEALDQSV